MAFDGLGAYKGRLVGGAHYLTALHAVGGANVMAKMGEGYPPPGAAMARIGWRSSCVIIATLLGMKMEKYRAEAQESLDQRCRDLTVMR